MFVGARATSTSRRFPGVLFCYVSARRMQEERTRTQRSRREGRDQDTTVNNHRPAHGPGPDRGAPRTTGMGHRWHGAPLAWGTASCSATLSDSTSTGTYHAALQHGGTLPSLEHACVQEHLSQGAQRATPTPTRACNTQTRSPSVGDALITSRHFQGGGRWQALSVGNRARVHATATLRSVPSAGAVRPSISAPAGAPRPMSTGRDGKADWQIDQSDRG